MGRLEEARAYARNGWHVFPAYECIGKLCACPKGATCPDVGKHPRITGWQHQATADQAQLEAWWAQWPNANIAIQTGEVSGFFGLDIDPRENGDDTLHMLEQQHGSLPETPVAYTGGGGVHYYFITDGTVRNITGLAPGIDIKGERGYLIAPTSTHESGVAYVWDAVTDYSVPCADAPTWLLDLITQYRQQQRGPAAIAAPDARVVPQNFRHNFLLEIAKDLRFRGVQERIATESLVTINAHQCQPPQSMNEVVALVTDVWQRYDQSIHVSLQTNGTAPAVVLGTSMEDLAMEKRIWIWEPFLIKYKFTLLDGHPGEGKSLFLIRLLADITAGRRIPGSLEEFDPVPVVWATIEDDPADTIKPRFLAAGGNPSLVTLLCEYHAITDLAYWETVFQAYKGAILVIDPLFTYLDCDANNGPALLNTLQPFTDLAERHDITIIATRHLTKRPHADPRMLGQGNASLAGVARSMLLLGSHPDEGDHVKLVAQVKHNLSRQGDTMRLRLEEVEHPLADQYPDEDLKEAVLRWDGTSDLRPHQFMAKDDTPEQIGPMEAGDFLQAILEDGPVPTSTIFSSAAREGISEKTLRRRKAEMHIISAKSGKSWTWQLPITAKL